MGERVPWNVPRGRKREARRGEERLVDDPLEQKPVRGAGHDDGWVPFAPREGNHGTANVRRRKGADGERTQKRRGRANRFEPREGGQGKHGNIA